MAPRTPHEPSPAQPAITSGLMHFQVGASATGNYDDHVLSVTLSGQVEFLLDENKHTFKEQTLLLVGPGVRQRWLVTASSHWSVVYVRFAAKVQWEPWLRQLLDGKPYRFEGGGSDRFAQVAQALREVDMHRSASRQPLSQELGVNALERAILIATSLLAGHGQTRHGMDPRIAEAMQWTLDRLDQPIGVEDMARVAKCSRSNFCRLFMRSTGEPPMKHLERLKMERAVELLRTTNLPVKQIASVVGFEDAKYFTKRFRLMTGYAPSNIRHASR